MIGLFKKWLYGEDVEPERPARQVASAIRAQPIYPPVQFTQEPEPEDAPSPTLDPHVEGRIENSGPGKNLLIRNKYLREDSGTHETLKILDDSMVDSGEETGIDPYNTGNFDRSRNWDKRDR